MDRVESISRIKSRELITSSACSWIPSNPRSFAVKPRSIGKDVPANAVMVGIPAKNLGTVSPTDKTFTPYGIAKEDDNKTDK